MMPENILKTILVIIELKSTHLLNHSIEVGHISYLLGKTMNLSDNDCSKLKIAGYLHDLGKIAVNDNILLKPSQLSDKEYEQMKMHPLVAVQALKKIADSTIDNSILEAILYHHENPDASGYFNKSNKEIPLLAKIIKIADVFSAMTSERPYKKAYPLEFAANYASRIFTDFQSNIIYDTLVACQPPRPDGQGLALGGEPGAGIPG